MFKITCMKCGKETVYTDKHFRDEIEGYPRLEGWYEDVWLECDCEKKPEPVKVEELDKQTTGVNDAILGAIKAHKSLNNLK